MKLPRPSGKVAIFVAVVAVALGALLWLWVGSVPGQAGSPIPQGAQASLTLQELVPLLTRYGVGPQDTSVDAVYAPPLFFEVSGETPPETPSLVFFLMESIHEDEFTTPPPIAFLQVDERGPYNPYQVKVLQNDIHHRSTRLLFSALGEDGRPLMDTGPHTLSLKIPAGDGTVTSTSTFSWELPLKIPGADRVSTASKQEAAETSEAVSTSALQLSAMAKVLQKTLKGVEYGGVGGIEVAATYATAEYFASVFPPEAAARYGPEKNFVFVVSETTHSEELPGEVPPPVLQIGGQEYLPDLMEGKVSSPHHRVTLIRFPADARLASEPGAMELLLPDGKALRWNTPISLEGTGPTSPFGLTWASILAMMAGLVAAMWPCLFQLTVFFIPALAGLGMEEASGRVAIGRRLQVVKAALFFILGFTVVYTAAGALMGFAAQRLGESADFQTWQRYIGIGGGVVIFVLALRVAARVRAPLVCKMPVLSRLSMRQKGSANPLELMFAGLAFATGCMTCFGAALVIAMVVYVGLSGSVAFGALIMFLFSLGMGIPLVIAATAMARALPLLFRMERVLPWMGLASSLLMMGFAALLISGNYMILTEWVYRTMGAGAFPR